MIVKYATDNDINYIKESLTSKQDGTEYLGYTWFEWFNNKQWYRTPVIVAKEWDIVIGFVILDYNSEKTECVLSSLYVYSNWRKKWVANKLYEFCLDEVKERSFNFIRTNVYDNNEPMKNFVTKLWFKQIGYRDYTHKRYWERWRLNFYWKFLD